MEWTQSSWFPSPPPLRGLTPVLLGLGKSTLAAARLLRPHVDTLTAVHQGTPGPRIVAAARELGIRLEASLPQGETLLCVVSPGLALSSPLVAAALARPSARLLSEIDIGCLFLSPAVSIAAITGTNGKSTTTHFLAHALNACGIRSVPCGNLGTPLCEVVPSAREGILCLELSSYQLETTTCLRPAASIFLNLTPDHLARYGTMESYLRSKWRLVDLTPAGRMLLGEGVVPWALRCGLRLPGGLQLLGTRDSRGTGTSPGLLPGYGGVDPASLARALGMAPGEISCSWEQGRVHLAGRTPFVPRLPGAHNQVNCLAAVWAGTLLGAPREGLLAQWDGASSTYTPLPHRLEDCQVRTYQGKSIRFVNDSKATNVESCLVALASLPRPLRVLVGGEPKGEGFDPLLGHPGVTFYPYGKAGPALGSVLDRPRSENLAGALGAALADAAQGDVIVLAPACASFDEFRDFEERGEAFRGLVLSLTGDPCLPSPKPP